MSVFLLRPIIALGYTGNIGDDGVLTLADFSEADNGKWRRRKLLIMELSLEVVHGKVLAF